MQSAFRIFSLRFFFPFLFIRSAAKAFKTLKKKYSRKRINFQKSSRSGAGTRDIETAKKELEEFSFLRWFDSFIRPRKTKTNIPELSMEINESSNAGDELENNGYGSDESEDATFDTMNEDIPSHLQRSRNQLHQKTVRKNRPRSNRSQGH